MGGVAKSDAEAKVSGIWRGAGKRNRRRRAGGGIDDGITVVASYRGRAVVAGCEDGRAAAPKGGQIITDPRTAQAAIAPISHRGHRSFGRPPVTFVRGSC